MATEITHHEHRVEKYKIEGEEIIISQDARNLRVGDFTVNLTKTEYKFFHLLLMHFPDVTPDENIQALGVDTSGRDKLIFRLRNKLGNILTIKRVVKTGYILR